MSPRPTGTSRSGAGWLGAAGSALTPRLSELVCLAPPASFKRPVVILGPIADIAMQKLSTELPELFEIARKCPPCRGEMVCSSWTLSVQELWELFTCCPVLIRPHCPLPATPQHPPGLIHPLPIHHDTSQAPDTSPPLEGHSSGARHSQSPPGPAGDPHLPQPPSHHISLSHSKCAPRRGLVQGHQAGLSAADRGEGERPSLCPRSRAGQGLGGAHSLRPQPSGADGRALPQDKHALLDITPSAVERLNYVQYYPVVVFCEPESRQGIKAMRQWLAPGSRKSSRRLYAQASKMKKHCSHLFTATVSLSGSGNAWYEAIKDIVRTQQSQPIWTALQQVRATGALWQGSASWAGDGATLPSPWSLPPPPCRQTWHWRTAWTC